MGGPPAACLEQDGLPGLRGQRGSPGGLTWGLAQVRAGESGLEQLGLSQEPQGQGALSMGVRGRQLRSLPCGVSHTPRSTHGRRSTVARSRSLGRVQPTSCELCCSGQTSISHSVKWRCFQHVAPPLPAVGLPVTQSLWLSEGCPPPVLEGTVPWSGPWPYPQGPALHPGRMNPFILELNHHSLIYLTNVFWTSLQELGSSEGQEGPRTCLSPPPPRLTRAAL